MAGNTNVFRKHEHQQSSVSRMREGHEPHSRKSLREVVCEIDRDILRLLLRRSNLLAKMRGANPRLGAADEKAIRESWEAAATRVSRDPRLSGHLFSLMQDIEFLPRPKPQGDSGQESGKGFQEVQHTAFNLAPAKKPVRLHIVAPLDCWASQTWLMLAAASGQPLRLSPCLMSTPVIDCVRMLTQAGAVLIHDTQEVSAACAAPMGTPDIVLHVGDNAWNFFMVLGHYLGRPSRVKCTGGTALKLADFSSVRRFLPTLGARLVPVIPKSEGLPVRLECSGMLPGTVSLPADVPAAFVEGLMLAAPGYEKPLAIDMAAHPDREKILARMLPVLTAVKADVRVEETVVCIHPSLLQLPSCPEVEMEAELAVFLLTLPLLLGGEVHLAGRFPERYEARSALDVLLNCGLHLHIGDMEITAESKIPLKKMQQLRVPSSLSVSWSPLLVALAACGALCAGEMAMPDLPDGTESSLVESFFHAVGVETDEQGALCKISQDVSCPIWNAPDPVWAMALALVACVRSHLKLGNPSVMTALYPAFWALYNGLPEPKIGSMASCPEVTPVPSRRRIITDAVALVPPEPREEE